jgi:succinate-acetate transporter protein
MPQLIAAGAGAWAGVAAKTAFGAFWGLVAQVVVTPAIGSVFIRRRR